MAAMESLKTYLDTWGMDLMGVPLVLQYNDRECPDTMPVDRLESLLNPWGLLSFPGSTVRREGIRETLKAILGLTLNHLKSQPQPANSVLPPELAGNGPPPEIRRAPDPALGLDYGPPVPGGDIEEATAKRTEAIFDELRPPIVIPVRIPRRLIEGKGPLKIELELEIDDGDGY